eukprot:Gb_30054 [translate_table: standard]
MEQALDLIRELQKQFPIKRSPMKLRLLIPENHAASFLEKLETWNTCIESKEVSGNQLSVVCQIEPGYFRDCDALVRDCKGRLDVLSVSVHKEGDVSVDEYNDDVDASMRNYQVSQLQGDKSPSHVKRLAESMSKTTLADNDSSLSGSLITRQEGPSGEPVITQEERRQQQCTTCNAGVGDAKQYRDHFKSDWHKHNLKRKMKQLPPLSPEECLVDREVVDVKKDLNDYSF